MTDLKIPNLNNKSDNYIFKKKFSLRRKSKRKLINESILLISATTFMILINSLIPDKLLFINSLSVNLSKFLEISLQLFPLLFQIILSILVLFSFIIPIVLFIAAFIRIFKVYRRKTKNINFN